MYVHVYVCPILLWMSSHVLAHTHTLSCSLSLTHTHTAHTPYSQSLSPPILIKFSHLKIGLCM